MTNEEKKRIEFGSIMRALSPAADKKAEKKEPKKATAKKSEAKK